MMVTTFSVFLLLQLIADTTNAQKPDIVTVCNSTYCRELQAVSWCSHPSFLHSYTTSEDGDRFLHKISFFKEDDGLYDPDVTIKLNPCQKYQNILGFGGALTDASALMITCLSPDAKKNLMDSYFHCEKGIGINWLRIPLGGSDYSEAPYTYDDSSSPDPNLDNFALNKLDTELKIPLIKEAQKISCNKINLKGATWRFPSWAMVEKQENISKLLETHVPPELYDMAVAIVPPIIEFYPKYFVQDQYWDATARYISKCLTDYKENGITFDIVSAGNEVTLGAVSDGWEIGKYQEWITNHLCPQLKKDGHQSTKLCALDDQTIFLRHWSKILENPETRSCVDGLATHWYFDVIPGAVKPLQEEFCETYPEKFLISSESSQCQTEEDFFSTTDWQKWDRFAKDIIAKLSTCNQAYIDWNIALNFQGGPNWLENYCYSAVAVNCSADEFHRRAMFYGFGHFSKFIPEGSVRIGVTVNYEKENQLEPLHVVAFEVKSASCAKRHTVVVALNTNDQDVKVNICYDKGNCAPLSILKKSIVSTVALKPLDYNCSS